jgi:hypothetical protein
VVVLCIVLTVQIGCLLLLWKDADRWVAFGRAFAVSPAMAGLAAVTAAAIGARALKKQLDQTIRQFEHTESEASHARGKDAEASWWEKFEWVTDRILHKDTKQTKLEKPLALNLLRSLHEMATADFQRAAVHGVIEHYLAPDNDDEVQPDQSPRNIDSELQALRALDEATKVTAGKSKVMETALRGVVYDQKALLALMELELPIEVEPRIVISEGQPHGRVVVPDAILTVDGRRVSVEFKGWHRFNAVGASRVADLAARLESVSAADDFLLVTSAEIPPRAQMGGHFGSLRLVHWLAEEGSAALEEKIRSALAPGNTLLRNESGL